ncbi:MAG TPA: dTDP-glucose 4,6-dehydratase, partial [Planctomycetaceae bacterium]|nr:dTDP-glucose 4,6-dehydratase [Planctomycetaceae bacterium]
VMDHCDAIDFLIEHGQDGQVYNIGAGNERTNLEITEFILKALDKPKSLMTFVRDRLGHDRRYSLDISKIKSLGWQPEHNFDEAMSYTIKWYTDNRWWWERLKSGEYLEYYKQNYKRDL